MATAAARSHQLVGGESAPSDQPVPDHDQVDQSELTGELDEHRHVAGDPHPAHGDHSCRVADVAADAGVVPTQLLVRDADVLLGDRGYRDPP